MDGGGWVVEECNLFTGKYMSVWPDSNRTSQDSTMKVASRRK